MKKLLLFFLLAYLLSWLVWLPLYGPALGMHGLPVLPYHHALGAFGPLASAFICARIFSDPGPSELLQKMFSTGNKTMLAIALVAPFILAILAMIALYLVNGRQPDLSVIGRSDEFTHFNIIIFTLYNILTFGFGEETGWRGYVLPVLQKRLNRLVSAILLTIFWAGWHLPLFLYRPGYTGMGVADITGWFFSLLTGSILLSWLYNKSKGSILVCAVFHATVDVVFTSAYPDKTIVSWLGAAITIAGIVAAIQLLKRPKNSGLLTDNSQLSY